MFNKIKMRTGFSMPVQIAAGIMLIFSIFFVVLVEITLASFKDHLQNVFISQQNVLVDRIGGDLNTRLVTLKNALIGSSMSVSENDISTSDHAQHYLDTNAGLNALFDRSVFLFSPQGNLIAERPFLPNRRRQNFSYREFIKEVVRTKKSVITDPFITTKEDKNAVLMFAAPVFKNNGELLAISTGSLGLTQPNMLGDIEKTVIGHTGYLYLVTKDGKIIMAPDKKYLLQRAFPEGKNPLFEKALRGFEGTELGIDVNGKNSLISFKRIPSTQWILAAVYPEIEAFSSFQLFKKRLTYLLFFFFTIFLFLGWSFTYRLIKKLKVTLDNLKKTNNELESVKLTDSIRCDHNTRFFQEASHDFSQRLHAMQLLIHTAERSSNSEIRILIARLAHGVELLQSYVCDFLEFARLETTSVNINLKNILMMDLFQRLELQFENVALEKKIELRFRYTSVELDTDEKKLLRILENLIANACKFARKKILVVCRRVSGGISIEVYDDGCGISAADSDKIFNVHYQGNHQKQNLKQEGIGLGLSIAQRLATCLGYTITFQTKITCGTVFKVRIPKLNSGESGDSFSSTLTARSIPKLSI